jgi:ribokinase
MGSKGALWLDKNGKEVFIEPTEVNAVDTSGAGDAFIGSFSHYFMRTGDIQTSLEKASLFAAFSVTEKGTQFSYPSIEQFEEFEQKHS